jgi:hypothetical protein
MGYEQQLTWAYAMQCLGQTCSDAGFPKASGQDNQHLSYSRVVVFNDCFDCLGLIISELQGALLYKA